MNEFTFEAFQYQSFGPSYTVSLRLVFSETEYKYMTHNSNEYMRLSEKYIPSFKKLASLIKKPGVTQLLDDYCDAFRDDCWTPHPTLYEIKYMVKGASLIDWQQDIGLFGTELPKGILNEIKETCLAIINEKEPHIIPQHYLDQFEKISYKRKRELNKKGEPKGAVVNLMDKANLSFYRKHEKDWWKNDYFPDPIMLKSFLKSLDDNLIDWRKNLSVKELKEAEDYVASILRP